ncbi:MAG: hypothetical protein ACTS3R_03945 [Inquilinaceae bacterium]
MNMVRIGAAVAMAVGIGGPAEASEAAGKIVEEARADCAAFDSGVLSTTDRTVLSVDLTGDGRPDDLVDTSEFSCSSAASLYCGTGGCSLFAVVDETVTNFLVKDWKIVTWADEPILLLAVHGAECGGTNLRRCFKAVVWSEGAFRSLDE